MKELDKQKKWRLILGKEADDEEQTALEAEAIGMDNALEALYNTDRTGGLGSSAPSVNRWLGDIRKYFAAPTVQIMQRDAIDRLGVQELLLEPELLEQIEPDVHLVGTLLTLNKLLPEKTKSTARDVIRKIVKQIEEKLRNPMRAAIQGKLNRAVRNRYPKWQEIDWNRTIRKNLKHYQPDLNAIIPEHLVGFGKKGNALKHIILLVDQSASMASSVVYASVFGAILASLRSVKTHFVVFDTNVVDLTIHLDDPVDLLFGTQLGGGTDIAKAMSYTANLIEQPNDTIIVLITDLFEGGNSTQLLQTAQRIQQSGAKLLCLLALNDEGAPSYDRSLAGKFTELNIPTFACTPDQFPDELVKQIG